MAKNRKLARLAAGEIEILEMLWRIRSATLAEAHEALARDIGYTTVQTRLNRLVAKGLAKKAGSHPARYEAAIKPEQVCRGDLDVLVARVTAGRIVPLGAPRAGPRAVRCRAVRTAATHRRGGKGPSQTEIKGQPMNTLALSILWALVRTGIVLSLSAVAVAAFLRLFHVASPTVRRTAYVAVLLQGWLLFESPFSVLDPRRHPFQTASRGPAVGWDQRARRAPAHRLSREEKVVSGKESKQKNTLLLRGIFSPFTFDSLAACHWRELWPASVFGSSSTAGPDEGVRVTPAIQDRSTLAADERWTSTPSQKSTGGPKLPPVARKQEPIGSVAASVAMPPSHERLFPWSLALASLWATGITFIAGRSAWAYLRFVHRFPASARGPARLG